MEMIGEDDQDRIEEIVIIDQVIIAYLLIRVGINFHMIILFLF